MNRSLSSPVRALGVAVSAAAGLALLAAPAPARACDRLELELMPAADLLQIAIWITDASGNYVDTVRLTRLVGTFGIGNRPGRSSTEPWGGFKTSPHFPYGKRLEVLPVWAWGRGVLYPGLLMQDGQHDWLGFHEGSSSDEPYFCRPQTPGETIDMVTCASQAMFNTDKGTFSGAPTDVVPYPPRNDVTMIDGVGRDDETTVPMMEPMNDLDAVTFATPASGDLVTLTYDSSALPPGDYIAWVEVNLEGDSNGDWWGTESGCPSVPGTGPLPCFTDCLLPEYGQCLSGQPSVVWQAAFSVEGPDDSFIVHALDYAGYGSPTGVDGALNPPDATITAGSDGTGAGRLAVMTGAGGDFRLSVACMPDVCTDALPPDPVVNAAQVPPAETDGDDFDRVTIRVVHPADDDGGRVTAYEIRYRDGIGSLDASNFQSGNPGPIAPPGDAGTTSDIVLLGLRGTTTYTVGIRAQDECLNWSAPSFFEVTTDMQMFTTVTPCGCNLASMADAGDGRGEAGTALVGALMLGAVALLRRRR